jgi:hypothetical protein
MLILPVHTCNALNKTFRLSTMICIFHISRSGVNNVVVMTSEYFYSEIPV